MITFFSKHVSLDRVPMTILLRVYCRNLCSAELVSAQSRIELLEKEQCELRERLSAEQRSHEEALRAQAERMASEHRKAMSAADSRRVPLNC